MVLSPRQRDRGKIFEGNRVDPWFSLPDAETGKDHSQQILGIDLAGDFAEGVEGFTEVDGGEFGVGMFLGEKVERGG